MLVQGSNSDRVATCGYCLWPLPVTSACDHCLWLCCSCSKFFIYFFSLFSVLGMELGASNVAHLWPTAPVPGSILTESLRSNCKQSPVERRTILTFTLFSSSCNWKVKREERAHLVLGVVVCPMISALKGKRWEDHKFEDILGHISSYRYNLDNI